MIALLYHAGVISLGSVMRTLVVGDVHGCSLELERLLSLGQPDRVVLVGDLFTKGPDPRGVWELIKSIGAEAVMGNHDRRVLKKWNPGKDLPKQAFEWLRERPAYIATDSWIAVHAALHPKGLHRTDPKVAIGLRAAPKRWAEHWRGPLAIYGHAAKAGLVDRRPYSLGLDTGCVSGGALSAYVVEEDRIISVTADRSYAAPAR